MPKLRHLSPIAAIAVALSLAVSGAEASGAHAAIKTAAPSLTLEQKVCNIGPAPADRFATIRALVGAPSTAGLYAALRFRVQERLTGGRWLTATTEPSTTAVNGWEVTTAAGTALRFTKAFKPLDEGAQFRILVDARGFDSSGKAATKIATKTYLCAQPLFTATLSLVKAVDTVAGSANTHTVTATVSNIGRLPSDAPVVTVMDAQTRGVLGTLTAESGLKGNTVTKIQIPITSCTGPLYVTVQETGADLADLTQAQSATIPCGGARASRLARR